MITAQEKSTGELGGTADGGKEHSVQIEVPEGTHDAGAVKSERYHWYCEVQSTTDHVALPNIGLGSILHHLGLSAAGPQISTIEPERVQIVTDAVPTPFLAAARIWHVAVEDNTILA